MGCFSTALKRLQKRLPTEPGTNYRYRDFDVNPYAFLPRNALILDIASKNARATYGFGSPPADATVLCVDIAEASGVDMVADAHELPLPSDHSVDCIVCVSFLYAARYPSKVVAEMHRVLKPGGLVYISVPYVFPRCADPGDFFRFSASGLEVLCEEFERVDGGFNRGPASTMHELIVRFLAMLLCFNSGALYVGWRYLLKWPLFWIKYLDKYVAHFRMADDICSGAYFIGRKKGYDLLPAYEYSATTENLRPAQPGFEPAVVYAARFWRTKKQIN